MLIIHTISQRARHIDASRLYPPITYKQMGLFPHAGSCYPYLVTFISLASLAWLSHMVFMVDETGLYMCWVVDLLHPPWNSFLAQIWNVKVHKIHVLQNFVLPFSAYYSFLSIQEVEGVGGGLEWYVSSSTASMLHKPSILICNQREMSGLKSAKILAFFL